VAVALVGCAGVGAAPAAEAQPAKIVGSAACRECHRLASDAWEKTQHFGSRAALETPAAARIRTGLGLKDAADATDACLRCHATVKLDGSKRRVIAGVSCESCHGGAADWIKVHGDFGSGKTKGTESSDHRDDRLGQSMAAGMLRPENLYRVVQNCFECHTVPEEALVNTGVHSAGSAIELVSWMQGAVRHNFGNDGGNREAPIERRRQLFVLGQMLDLEFSLRGLATSTVDGPHAQALVTRGRNALALLQRMQGLAQLAELDAVVKAGTAVPLALGSQAALLAAADAISTAAQDFGDAMYGRELSGLDALLPSSDQYKGRVHQP
jgi:hypothetical protein